MINSIRADESLQILIFVCVPLVLLLVAVITLLSRGRRTTATFPTFSVSISKVGRAEAYVTYRVSNKQIEFDAEISRGKKFFKPKISIQVSSETPDEDVQRIVSNLVLGLAKLHYEYLIFRKGEPQVVPEQEREAAVAELRRMGFEIEGFLNHGRIQRAVTHNWQRTSGEQAKVMVSRVQSLMSKAAGVRENIEVLAQGQ